ncbi:MAG: hypothetical protein H6970_00455 [Gammaproteobacteria bacterium]|nr:hypothetical protein [Gammaproteobacteria bacterium]MCP5423530.1 hypothetical protein [Gammaproteobacteria bacterium]
MRKTILLVALSLIALPASAANWRYIVYLGETVISDGPTLPLDVDLTYPADGQSASAIRVGAEPRGRLLTDAEYAEELTQPHIVIVPPDQTKDARPTQTDSTLGVPMQFGHY